MEKLECHTSEFRCVCVCFGRCSTLSKVLNRQFVWVLESNSIGNVKTELEDKNYRLEKNLETIVISQIRDIHAWSKVMRLRMKREGNGEENNEPMFCLWELSGTVKHLYCLDYLHLYCPLPVCNFILSRNSLW